MAWPIKMLAMCLLPTFSAAAYSETNSNPVLWRPSEMPVTSGYGSIVLEIAVFNPCETFTSEILYAEMVESARNQCERMYQEKFLKELEKLQSLQHGDNKGIRPKRELMTITFVFMCITIYSAVVGTMAGVKSVMNGEEMSQMQQETRRMQNEIEIERNKLDDHEQRIEKMRTKFNDLIARLGIFERDFQDWKKKQVATAFLISHTTSQIDYAARLFKETGRQLKAGKVHAPFLDYFNVSLSDQPELSCKEFYCPLHLATLESFVYIKATRTIFFEFIVPYVDESQKLVIADPFRLMMQKPNETCEVSYIGPKNAMVSNTSCVAAINVDTTQPNLILFPKKQCLAQDRLPDEKKYFEVSRCAPRHPSDNEFYIQVKLFHGQFHIYCPNSNFTIANNTHPCGNNVFIIPISQDFTIGDFPFKSSEVHIKHVQEKDPMYTYITNWYLHPSLNFSDLIIPPPPPTTSYPTGSYMDYIDHPMGYSTMTLALLFFFAILVVIVVYKRYKRAQKILAFAGQAGIMGAAAAAALNKA